MYNIYITLIIIIYIEIYKLRNEYKRIVQNNKKIRKKLGFYFVNYENI